MVVFNFSVCHDYSVDKFYSWLHKHTDYRHSTFTLVAIPDAFFSITLPDLTYTPEIRPSYLLESSLMCFMDPFFHRLCVRPLGNSLLKMTGNSFY